MLSKVVGRGLAPAETVVECMPFGRIAEQQLLLLPKRYPYLTVDNYVIMPNHIHAIFVLGDMAAGASPRPTLTDVVCAFKSLTTRECKKHGLTEELFQTSFYDHVIRCREDYDEIYQYIFNNPMQWKIDKLYAE